MAPAAGTCPYHPRLPFLPRYSRSRGAMGERSARAPMGAHHITRPKNGYARYALLHPVLCREAAVAAVLCSGG